MGPNGSASARRGALVLASALVLVLVASLVPGASAEVPAGSSGSCKNDQGVSDNEIKVGVILPKSGPQATSFSDALNGIQARVDKANADQETGKRKITLVDVDDVADNARNLTAAQQVVQQDGVFGVIEVTSAAEGGAKFLNQQGVPVVGWHVGVPAFGRYKNMFGWRNTVPADPLKTFDTRNADLLKQLGATKIALVGTNQTSSANFIKKIDQAVKKTKGLKVVYKTTDLSVSDREFTGVVQQIKDSGADGMYTGMDFLQNTALNSALQQAGVQMKAVIFPGGYDDRTLSLPGMEGAYFGVEFKPFELNPPAYTEYKAGMDALGKHAAGQVPYNGWLSADTFIRGLNAAGINCPTRKNFIKNLRKVKDFDGNGAYIPVDFNDIFGRTYYCVYYVRVQNQQFVPQFDGNPFCATRVIDDGKVTKLSPEEQAKG
jgi:branched-chain amino acid transport system substrate-binding protein